jgi:predicted transcriptional regulator YheO
LLGDWCEVVVHDLSDLEHSIICVRGSLTGREIGGHMTDLGLAKLRAGQTDPVLNYTTFVGDKTLRSSSVFVHDADGKPIAAFCINLDISPLLPLQHFVGDLARSQEPDVEESFFRDVPEMVEALIAESVMVGGSWPPVTKEDRMEVVAALDEAGLFQMRRSVPLVAERLGVTPKTIYNYLTELESHT